MRLDNTDHPVSQNASRVGFTCFLGLCVLALADATRERSVRPTWFWVTGGVLIFLGACALIAYFRPRGVPAYITSTAYVGVFIMAGAGLAASRFHGRSGWWVPILAAAVIVGWMARGIQHARDAHRRRRFLE